MHVYQETPIKAPSFAGRLEAWLSSCEEYHHSNASLNQVRALSLRASSATKMYTV